MSYKIKLRRDALPPIPRQTKPDKLAAEGKRHVDFVIDVALWERFKAVHCQTEKPNEVFCRLIVAAVDGKEVADGVPQG